MKRYIYIAALLVISMTPAMTERHGRGEANECWYDRNYHEVSNYSWAYYFCGPVKSRCHGHYVDSDDQAFVLYHGDTFVFQTWPQERFYCCHGSQSGYGQFVRADKWIVEERTEKVEVAGGTCNKLIQKDVCGDLHETACNTPDNCPDGMILRNKACVVRCEGDEVFESTTSNACIPCETSLRQGPSEDHTTCIKCDSLREFFDRENHKCISKTSQNLVQYTKEAMQECWKCPRELYATCVKAIGEVNNTGYTGSSRLNQIDQLADLPDRFKLSKQCKLEAK